MKLSYIPYPVFSIHKHLSLTGLMLIAVLGLVGCTDAQLGEFATGRTYPARAYTKIDSTGNPLPDQSKAWNTNDATASEANFDRWSCVLDDASGLVFEIKTQDDGLRDYRHQYTWYNSNPATNRGEHGIGDLGVGVTTNYEAWHVGEAFPGSDNCFDANRCDIEKYVADVNAAGLCGYSDWRMPAEDELALLLTGAGGVFNVSKSFYRVDQDYFPEPYDSYMAIDLYEYVVFWSGSSRNLTGTVSGNGEEVAESIDFNHGYRTDVLKEHKFHVRLVRDSIP